MRTAILSYTGAITIILMVACISVITMKISYTERISDSLDTSITYAVSMLQKDRDMVRADDAYLGSGDASIANALTLQTAVDASGNPLQYTAANANEAILANEQLKERFISYLVSQLDHSIRHVDVDIYALDASTGLLSARVTATFAYPSGATDTIICDKTVILDRFVK